MGWSRQHWSISGFFKHFSPHVVNSETKSSKKDIPPCSLKRSGKGNHTEEKGKPVDERNLNGDNPVDGPNSTAIKSTQPHVDPGTHGGPEFDEKNRLHDSSFVPPQPQNDISQPTKEPHYILEDVEKRHPLVPKLSGSVQSSTKYPAFEGTCSNIFKGIWNNTLVAIKVLRGPGMSVQTKERLYRELPIWCSLEHENILQIHGYSEDFGKYGAMISPWCSGGNAGEYIQQGLVNLSERFQLWCDVVEGVAYLHSHDPVVVHGDLKPTNVLVDDEGRAKICDFGLTRIFSEGVSDYTTPVNSGTMRYLAYELIVAEEPVVATKPSDVYAIGCLGLEFVFRKVPYSNRHNPAQIYRDVSKNVPPSTHFPLNVEPTGVIQEIWEMFNRCWNTNPRARPSADELKEFVRDNRIRLMEMMESGLVALPSD
ncbi:kinase-like protein [Serendipita vermifera]|nr:kinase-like protein [Serendipita vermifera]